MASKQNKKEYKYPYTYELVMMDKINSVKNEINIYGKDSIETTTKLTNVMDQLADWGLFPWIRKVGQAKKHTPEVEDLIAIINCNGFLINEVIDAEIRLEQLGVVEKKS